MSFLEEAAAFTAQKEAQQSQKLPTFLSTSALRESFEKEVRDLYENATWVEIRRAIDWGIEHIDPPYDKKQFLEKIRIKLED